MNGASAAIARLIAMSDADPHACKEVTITSFDEGTCDNISCVFDRSAQSIIVDRELLVVPHVVLIASKLVHLYPRPTHVYYN